jgi:flagellar biosynthesis protein FlhG
VQQRASVLEAYPRSPAAFALRQLAEQVEHWPRARGASGHLEFFFERMLQPAAVALGG